MNRKGLTVLQLLIIIAVTGFVAYLLISNHSGKKISASDTLVTPSQETAIPENKKEEIKIIPSDVEEAFQTKQKEKEMISSNTEEVFQSEEIITDFVLKDKIPKLKVEKKKNKNEICKVNNTLCGSDSEIIRYMAPLQVIDSVTGKTVLYNNCKRYGYYDINGERYKCRIASYGVVWTDYESSEKVEGKGLEILNCEKNGYFELNGTKYSCPFKPVPISYQECLKIKDKLGIKECFDVSSWPEGDKWAGAVKQCGGVQNLPTMKDLADISSVIYEGHPSFEPYDDKFVRFNPGFWHYTNLWSNEELGKCACIRRPVNFYSHDVRAERGGWFHSYAICKLK